MRVLSGCAKLAFPVADVCALLWGRCRPPQFAEVRQIEEWVASYPATLVPHPNNSIQSERISEGTGAWALVALYASSALGTSLVDSKRKDEVSHLRGEGLMLLLFRNPQTLQLLLRFPDVAGTNL